MTSVTANQRIYIKLFQFQRMCVIVVNGLLCVANSRSVAECLHHTFHLMSVLANFLRLHLPVASDVNICLVRYLIIFLSVVVYNVLISSICRHFLPKVILGSFAALVVQTVESLAELS